MSDTPAHNEWWRSAVIYQIYPRSFQDTNNDGIGDLPGITQHMKYIADLGVDGIWISPFFKSPMKDYGYDVSDYRDVDPIFGTLDDFKQLIRHAHDLNIKVIIDLVLSHTSDKHPWFDEAEKKDWYVWADAKRDKDGNRIPPNNWQSVFGGSAWEWDDRYNQYYLHNFLTEQPDLNFHNMAVQEELLDICKFWLDMGVDGFRLDTVNFYFHDQSLRDNPPREEGTDFATQFEIMTPYSAQQHIYDKSQPENLDFIARMRELTDQYDARMMVGEIGDDHPYRLARDYTRGSKHLHTTYNTHLMSGTEKEPTECLIREPLERFFGFHIKDDHLKESDESVKCIESGESAEVHLKSDMGWPSWAFSNHDVVRVASRWHKLYGHQPELSKTLNAMLCCLPGTIFMYQGEELGLPEAEIPFDSLQDPWAKETWPDWQGRDGCRTPMVWDCEKTNCGFSENKPWLPVPLSHNQLCVQQQLADESSPLVFTKKFLRWRKNQEVFTHPDFKFIHTNHSKIIHILRKTSKYETNCIFNLSAEKVTYLNHILPPYGFHVDGFTE